MTEPERLGIRLVLKPPYFIDLYWKQGDPHIVLTVREGALLGWHEKHISVNVPLNGWDIIAEFVAAVREAFVTGSQGVEKGDAVFSAASIQRMQKRLREIAERARANADKPNPADEEWQWGYSWGFAAGVVRAIAAVSKEFRE